jgi:hypothetical protein
VALFAEEQTAPIDDEQIIQVRLKDLEVRNARSGGTNSDEDDFRSD